jgi:hypothetical protein
LSTGIDGDQVISRLDEIAGATAAEESAAALAATTAGAASAAKRTFSRSQVYFSGSEATALPSAASTAREPATSLCSLSQRA